ncbi:MAG: hypothetical protein R6U92_06580 [Bacillota bacterium]
MRAEGRVEARLAEKRSILEEEAASIDEAIEELWRQDRWFEGIVDASESHEGGDMP